jgi:hypothetical protein
MVVVAVLPGAAVLVVGTRARERAEESVHG